MKKQSENQNNNQNGQDENLEEEQAKEQQEEFDRLKTKQLPAMIMLLGGAVAALVTYTRDFSLKDMLVIVLISLIGFYILGLILKRIFDSFRIKRQTENEEGVAEEGEVIEKEPEEKNEKSKSNKK
jgi:Ca2+/H+ antiporter